jgi:hypothetical protein
MMYRDVILITAVALQYIILPAQAIPGLQDQPTSSTVASSSPAATVAVEPSAAAATPATENVQNDPFQSMLSKFLHIKPTATPSSIPRMWSLVNE